MKKQWNVDDYNFIALNEKAKTVIVYSGDWRSGGDTTYTFAKWLKRHPRNDCRTDRFYDQVCLAIRQLDMAGLTDEAVCWANLANE